MAPTKYANRRIPKISLHDFDTRVGEITSQLVHAAETDGFFGLTNHGISLPEIESMFEVSASFFGSRMKPSLSCPSQPKMQAGKKTPKSVPQPCNPTAKKATSSSSAPTWRVFGSPIPCYPDSKTRAGVYEKGPRRERETYALLARGLGFSDDYFIRADDISRPESQTVLRLLQYFSVDSTLPIPEGYYRAGGHVDWDFITLLFQRAGQSGLEIWKSFIDNDIRH